jgi:hypothetical protein
MTRKRYRPAEQSEAERAARIWRKARTRPDYHADQLAGRVEDLRLLVVRLLIETTDRGLVEDAQRIDMRARDTLRAYHDWKVSE